MHSKNLCFTDNYHTLEETAKGKCHNTYIIFFYPQVLVSIASFRRIYRVSGSVMKFKISIAL